MATMDIFEGDAFTIVELTRALENIPFKPALLSGSNLFSPRGVRSRTVVIESRDGTLSLIPFSERGSAYEQQVPDRREMRAFVCRQFKKQDVLWASEIQGIRDFGSETAVQQVQVWGQRSGVPVVSNPSSNADVYYPASSSNSKPGSPPPRT